MICCVTEPALCGGTAVLEGDPSVRVMYCTGRGVSIHERRANPATRAAHLRHSGLKLKIDDGGRRAVGRGGCDDSGVRGLTARLAEIENDRQAVLGQHGDRRIRACPDDETTQHTRMDRNHVLRGRVGEVGKAGELGPLSISRSEGAAMDGGGASVRMSKREGPVAARGGWDSVAEGQQMSYAPGKRIQLRMIRTSNRSWCSRTAAGRESKVSEQLSHDVHGIVGASSVGGGCCGEVKK